MNYIHTSGKIKTLNEIKKENPTISFPSINVTNALLELGYNFVNSKTPPVPSSSTKIFVKDGAEKNKDGNWEEKWVETDRHADIEGGKTKAEQDKEYQTILDNDQKNLLRAERMPLLEEADWEINKIFDASGDASKWKSYRQELRDITKASDIYNVTWPTKPS